VGGAADDGEIAIAPGRQLGSLPVLEPEEQPQIFRSAQDDNAWEGPRMTVKWRSRPVGNWEFAGS
jgi:hypothetical protein